MQNIKYEGAAYKEYQLNGGEIVRINVADVGMIARYKHEKERMNKIANSIGAHPTAADIEKADHEIRMLIDGVFGEGVSAKAFGSVNCLSPTASGSAVCVNFLRAFAPVVMADLKAVVNAAKISIDESKLNNERTQSYTKPVLTYAGQYTTTAGDTYIEKSGKLFTDEQKAFLKELLEE